MTLISLCVIIYDGKMCKLNLCGWKIGTHGLTYHALKLMSFPCKGISLPFIHTISCKGTRDGATWNLWWVCKELSIGSMKLVSFLMNRLVQSLMSLILSAPRGVGVLIEGQHFCERRHQPVMVLGNGLEWCLCEVLFCWLCVQPISCSFLQTLVCHLYVKVIWYVWIKKWQIGLRKGRIEWALSDKMLDFEVSWP